MSGGGWTVTTSTSSTPPAGTSPTPQEAQPQFPTLQQQHRISPEIAPAAPPGQARRSPQGLQGLPVPNSQQHQQPQQQQRQSSSQRGGSQSRTQGVSPTNNASGSHSNTVAGGGGGGGGTTSVSSNTPTAAGSGGGGGTGSGTGRSPEMRANTPTSTSGVNFDPETHVEVYSTSANSLLILPFSDICYLPANPSDPDATSGYKLCPNFDPLRPFDSCPAACKCRYVHARTENALAHDIHVNYAWQNLEDVAYERFPPGQLLAVAPPNQSNATDDMPSHLVLKTRALQSNRRVISHCAHYYFNRTCNRGAQCFFIHAVSLAPSRDGKEDPHRRIWGRTQTRNRPAGAAGSTPPLAPMRTPTNASTMLPAGGGSVACAATAAGGGGSAGVATGAAINPNAVNVGSFSSSNPSPNFSVTSTTAAPPPSANNNKELSPYAHEWAPGVPGGPPPPGVQLSPFQGFSSGGVPVGSGGGGGEPASLLTRAQQQQQAQQRAQHTSPNSGGSLLSSNNASGLGDRSGSLPPMDLPPAMQNASGSGSAGSGGSSKLVETADEAQLVDNVMNLCADDE